MEKYEKQIYDYIVGYITEHGYAPSVREIADAVGFHSPSSAKYVLDKMIRDGYLETDTEPRQPRAIRVPGYHFVKDS